MLRAAASAVFLGPVFFISSCGYGRLSVTGEQLPRDHWRTIALADYNAKFGHPIRICTDIPVAVARDEQTAVLTELVAM